MVTVLNFIKNKKINDKHTVKMADEVRYFQFLIIQDNIMDDIVTYILFYAYSNGIINVSPMASSTKNNWILMLVSSLFTI